MRQRSTANRAIAASRLGFAIPEIPSRWREFSRPTVHRSSLLRDPARNRVSSPSFQHTCRCRKHIDRRSARSIGAPFEPSPLASSRRLLRKPPPPPLPVSRGCDVSYLPRRPKAAHRGHARLKSGSLGARPEILTGQGAPPSSSPSSPLPGPSKIRADRSLIRPEEERAPRATRDGTGAIKAPANSFIRVLLNRRGGQGRRFRGSRETFLFLLFFFFYKI